MLIANEDYLGVGKWRQDFFNIAGHPERRVSEGQRLRWYGFHKTA